MHTVRLANPHSLDEWRQHARALLSAGVSPGDVLWTAEAQSDLFSPPAEPQGDGFPVNPPPSIRVPKAFPTLAEMVLCHRDPARYSILYRMLVRLQTERALLAIGTDPDVMALGTMARAVGRDCRLMQGLVRFREVPALESSGPRRRFVAWFEPDHFIVGRTAPFFCRRFSDMDWAILTPRGSAVCVGQTLTISPEPALKPTVSDATDDLWCTYYANIFNPSRLKVKTMKARMPKYWANLPEAALISPLIATAPARVQAMADQVRQDAPPLSGLSGLHPGPVSEPRTPAPVSTLAALHKDIAECTRCPLHCGATQAVCGEGPQDANLMIVGEQPGDREDLAGRPFIGPAGQLLDRVLVDCGLDRACAYVTNAVKHFKYDVRGQRRLHKTANDREVELCRWWLTRELALVRPRLVLALGVTALRSLSGSRQTLGSLRGRLLPFDGADNLIATVHPSYLLRIPDQTRRAEETARFRADIALAAGHLGLYGMSKGEKTNHADG